MIPGNKLPYNKITRRKKKEKKGGEKMRKRERRGEGWRVEESNGEEWKGDECRGKDWMGKEWRIEDWKQTGTSSNTGWEKFLKRFDPLRLQWSDSISNQPHQILFPWHFHFFLESGHGWLSGVGHAAWGRMILCWVTEILAFTFQSRTKVRNTQANFFDKNLLQKSKEWLIFQ